MTRSLETLYREHGPDVLAYLRRLGGVSAAEDLLHETFVQAMRRMDRFEQAQSPRAWLFGIARHVGLTERRRRRPAAPLVEEPAAPAAGEDERVEPMRRAIDELPEPQREALELRVRSGLSYEEIAVVLAIPVGTVRSRLHHAVRRLREALGE
jgi:RNA polymerase sigma-70 factor (ECF subfamily)